MRQLRIFPPNRNNGLKIRVSGKLTGAESRVTLHDEQLSFGGVPRAAVDKFLDPVCHVGLGLEGLFNVEPLLFRLFSRTLVYEHLLGDFFGLGAVLDKKNLKLMLEKVGHGLLDELVCYGFFGLIFIGRLGGEGGNDQHKALVHVLKGDFAFVFLILSGGFYIGVDLGNKGAFDRLFGGSAVFEKAGIVEIFLAVYNV